jgi:hypothetical protein
MFVHLPFGHTEVRVDPRRPRGTRIAPALDVIRRLRGGGRS